MLKGKTIVTTQPSTQANELMELLMAKGAIAISMPMIETRTISLGKEIVSRILSESGATLLVFTSKKGVKGFFENIKECCGSFHLPSRHQIAVVGEGTAVALAEFGHQAIYVNPDGNSQSFIPYLKSLAMIGNPQIWLLLGNLAPADLENELSGLCSTHRVNVYETVETQSANESQLRIMKSGSVDMCIFTSPSGFRAFQRIFNGIPFPALAAIGNTTASAIRRYGFEVNVVAQYPSAAHLVEAVENYFRNSD